MKVNGTSLWSSCYKSWHMVVNICVFVCVCVGASKNVKKCINNSTHLSTIHFQNIFKCTIGVTLALNKSDVKNGKGLNWYLKKD